MNIKLKERPNKKISGKKDSLTLLKNGKKMCIIVEFMENAVKVIAESKESLIKDKDTFRGFPLSWEDNFYKKVEELSEGRIIGCLNCKYFATEPLLYDQSSGYGGICTFNGNNKDKRVTYHKDEHKDAFVREINGKEIKITGILDYCPEFILENKQ